MNITENGRVNASKVPHMVYAEQAYEELKQEDPNTAITLWFIKGLISSGKIPSIKVGRRRLFNYDTLLEYLANPPAAEHTTQYGAIRRATL